MKGKLQGARSGAPKREIELDFIRGLAILLVLSFHYKPDNLLVFSPFLLRLETFGWTGVDLFFVLSGFLVGGLMLKEWRVTGKVDAIRFLKRRAFKIWPAYYLFLFAAAIAHVRPLRSFFWQNFFSIQNYIPTSLSHTWSLAVEEHFYLSLAALIAFAAAKRWRVSSLLIGCLITALAVEILRAFLILTHRPFYFYTHSRIDALLLGVVLAILKQFYPERFAWLQRQWLPLCIVVAAALVALYFDTDAIPVTQNMTSPCLITLVDYGCAALLLLLYRPGKKHWMPYRVIARMGIFSYGIYLWHVSVERPVGWVVHRTSPSLTPVVSTFLPYLLAIAIGIVSTKLIELPMLRMRERMVPATIPEPPVPVG